MTFLYNHKGESKAAVLKATVEAVASWIYYRLVCLASYENCSAPNSKGLLLPVYSLPN
ncbi:hypothetical protein DPMN_095797 [Dreissena polymorpha]|uniref:Uncharacterized protein n=1 Tax=Dreissena polymorpha TaxID=45954 RepID=A0A9D4R4V6_DREPO|nr:hypothetical protein DPMN_095797 [Dreissena polymorpha]